jgi:hypothetical protein
MTAITLALDFGASFLRAIMTKESFKPELFLIEPQVTRVTSSSIEDYNNFKIGSGDLVKSSWIEYGGELYAIGNLAKSRFQGSLQLEKRKFELALPKVLAVVGAISEIHQLPNGTSINLAVVLPYGEYRDRDLFGQILTKALAGFKFCSLEKSFVLDTFICLPEGGGVLTQGRPVGTSFKDLELIVLMIGFRDVSILFVDRGEMSKGITAPLGFFNLCKSVAEKTSLSNYQQLTQAICKAYKNANTKALLPLLSNVGDSYKDYELKKIQKAIIQAREEYWLMLSQWLKLQIKDDVDEVIVAGGTANFLRPELKLLLKSSKVLWCDELERRINSSFSDQIKANCLQYRLADVYGLFFYLLSRLERIAKATKSHD